MEIAGSSLTGINICISMCRPKSNKKNNTKLFPVNIIVTAVSFLQKNSPMRRFLAYKTVAICMKICALWIIRCSNNRYLPKVKKS